MPTPKNLHTIADAITGVYHNQILSSANDHVLRLSVMTEPYHWHSHPNSDEIFIGVEGTVLLFLPDETIRIGKGDVVTVPAGTIHATAPDGPRSVNMTVERRNAETRAEEAPRGTFPRQ